jgi:hypothetical protein
MCVLICSTNFVWNISHFKKKWASYDQKYILVFMKNTRYSCHILMELEFSRQIKKNSQIPNFMKILSVGVELLYADRRTDGETEWEGQ